MSFILLLFALQLIALIRRSMKGQRLVAQLASHRAAGAKAANTLFTIFGSSVPISFDEWLAAVEIVERDSFELCSSAFSVADRHNRCLLMAIRGWLATCVHSQNLQRPLFIHTIVAVDRRRQPPLNTYEWAELLFLWKLVSFTPYWCYLISSPKVIYHCNTFNAIWSCITVNPVFLWLGKDLK